MNKLKKVLSLAIAFVVGTVFFAACYDNSTDSSASSVESSVESSIESADSHVHVFSEVWETTYSYHWHECECGKRADVSKHVGEATSCTQKPYCEVCDAEFGEPADHTYGQVTDIGDGVPGFNCVGCSKTIPLLSEEKDGEFVEGIIDFAVEVEEGKDPIVLQLSDPQICNWGDVEKMCYSYIRETVTATKPDLIILTGDIVYGRFDEDGRVLLDFIEFMESLQIPWAPVFGNHDNECLLGVDWQCEQFEKAEYCLFEQRDLTGNGNYSVGIVQGGEILRVFYMLDSNGCGNPMIDSDGNPGSNEAGKNVVKTSTGFGSSQEAWYNASIKELKSIAPDVKISFAFHIQPFAFLDAFQKYDEYDGRTTDGQVLKNPLNLDTMETADETDFGYLGRVMKGAWDGNYSVYRNIKELGVDSIFVGHEHCNSASIVYDGIRFQYGQKSSTYDRYNAVKADGTIVGDYNAPGTPLMGGSVIPLSQEDGSIINPYIYLCGDPFGLNP